MTNRLLTSIVARVIGKDEGIVVERAGAVAIVTLDRPARLNAFSYALLRTLDRLLDGLRDDLSCRVLVLTGAGRAFSAGMDLEEVSTSRWDDTVGDVQSSYGVQAHVGRIVTKLRRIPQPVVAAVNGVAAGGGFALALAADFRIIEPAARFNAAFVKIGASGGDMGSSFFLPRIVGFERAAELLFTGRFVDADEAIEIGLASRLVGSGESRAAALELAHAICANAPFGTRMTKSLLNQSMDGASLEQAIELENRTQVMLSRTADFAEAVSAFAEKRDPCYADR